RWLHDLSRQTEAPPPRAAQEQARLHAPRLRRRRVDALRGLRARLDLVRDHPGVLRARRCAASGREALRHRLFVEDTDLLPGQFARLQQRARAYALGADWR